MQLPAYIETHGNGVRSPWMINLPGAKEFDIAICEKVSTQLIIISECFN